LAGWCINWEVRIKPKHVNSVIGPERHDEHHATIKCFAHGLQAASGSESIRIASPLLLGRCKVVRDRAVFSSADVDWSGLNNLAVLNVDSLDLGQVSSIRVVRCDELGHDCDWLRGIDCKLRARAKERGVAQTVRRKVGTILVAKTVLTLASVVIAAGGSVAPGLAVRSARVRRECLRD
jgi:hypothetical protein